MGLKDLDKMTEKGAGILEKVFKILGSRRRRRLRDRKRRSKRKL